MAKRNLLCGAALLGSIIIPAGAHAQATWESVADANLRHISMACNYVYNSTRNAEVIESNDTTAVISARYDYRCGDSTLSDTVYMTFRNGERTCHAFAFYNQHCTMDGDVESGRP